jgi:hypothetical protein
MNCELEQDREVLPYSLKDCELCWAGSLWSYPRKTISCLWSGTISSLTMNLLIRLYYDKGFVIWSLLQVLLWHNTLRTSFFFEKSWQVPETQFLMLPLSCVLYELSDPHESWIEVFKNTPGVLLIKLGFHCWMLIHEGKMLRAMAQRVCCLL